MTSVSKSFPSSSTWNNGMLQSGNEKLLESASQPAATPVLTLSSGVLLYSQQQIYLWFCDIFWRHMTPVWRFNFELVINIFEKSVPLFKFKSLQVPLIFAWSTFQRQQAKVNRGVTKNNMIDATSWLYNPSLFISEYYYDMFQCLPLWQFPLRILRNMIDSLHTLESVSWFSWSTAAAVKCCPKPSNPNTPGLLISWRTPAAAIQCCPKPSDQKQIHV